MIQWRQHLHVHPESAFEEAGAANYLAGILKEMGLEVTEGIGKTGLIATLKSGDGGGLHRDQS